MAFPHEFRRRELHCRPWRRGETRGDLGKAGHEVDRRDDKSEADRGADRLAERADVDDPSSAIERCQRRRGPARQLQLDQIVVLYDPDPARGGPVEQSEAPLRSEEHTSELQSLMRRSYTDF